MTSVRIFAEDSTGARDNWSGHSSSLSPVNCCQAANCGATTEMKSLVRINSLYLTFWLIRKRSGRSIKCVDLIYLVMSLSLSHSVTVCRSPLCRSLCPSLAAFHRNTQRSPESPKHCLCGLSGVDQVWSSGPRLEESFVWRQSQWPISGNRLLFLDKCYADMTEEKFIFTVSLQTVDKITS